MVLASRRLVVTKSIACTALAAVILAGAPGRGDACSLSPFPESRVGGAGAFIGTALGDTILAGAGRVAPRRGQGHFGAGTARPVYGQVVRATRLSMHAPRVLLQALGSGGGDVVLVPWDYDPACQPLYWSRSARWIQAGTQGLYRGALRERAHWVGGLPTFDVHAPELVPYPSAPGFQRMLGRRSDVAMSDGVLTADELLTLYDALPEFPEPPAQVDSAHALVRPLQDWIRGHPHLALRQPARDMIRSALSSTEYMRVRAIRSPMAGTYRFTMTMPSGDSLVIFARAMERDASPVWSVSGESPVHAEGQIPRAVGYSLLVEAALRADSLRRSRQWEYGPSPYRREGSFKVFDPPGISTPDSTVWWGTVDLTGPAISQVNDERLRPQLQIADRGIMELYGANEPVSHWGRFVRYRDGRIRFKTDLRRRDGAPILVIRGERISMDVLADRPWPPPMPMLIPPRE